MHSSGLQKMKVWEQPSGKESLGERKPLGDRTLSLFAIDLVTCCGGFWYFLNLFQDLEIDTDLSQELLLFGSAGWHPSVYASPVLYQ